jgi:DNA-binding LytR/AlgR family response regulator
MENMLNKQQFFRANRQFIINRDIIRGVEHHFNRRLLVDTICQTPEVIIISRLKVQDFLRWLES